MLPPEWDEARYTAAFAAVRAYIAAGDSYQVNLTFRQRFRFAGEPFALYRRLCAAQPAAFCAWLDLDGTAIASASPSREIAPIAATIAEEAFEDLDAPVKRIAAPDSPVPFSPPLERRFLPQVEDVVAGMRDLAAY